MGDPAGIGPDCTLLAWVKREELALPPFVVVGDPDLFSARAHALGIDFSTTQVGGPEDVADCFSHALPLYPVLLPKPIAPGVPDETSATTIIEAIEVAFGWTRDRRTGALVTNPINKKLLQESGFDHPGHTEFLAQLCTQGDTRPRPVMLLTGGDLRVVPVTVHLPLKDVSAALSEQLIVETVEIAAALWASQ